MSSIWSTKVYIPSESSRTSDDAKRSLGNQDLVAKGFSVVKWIVHLFRTLLKKSLVEVWEPYRTDLERVAFRTLDKPRRAIGKYSLILLMSSQ
jgi:hypothetical protein